MRLRQQNPLASNHKFVKMGRTLNEIIDALPKERRQRVEARYRELKSAMKVGKRKLKMSSGETRTFRSEQARDSFERVAKAVKHGFRPTGKRTGKRKS